MIGRYKVGPSMGRHSAGPSSAAELSPNPAADERTPTYQGSLQGVGNSQVLGWCWNPATPQERVRITIAVDGETIAEGVADIRRPDLAAYGDGAHGFLVSLPESLQAPGRRRVLALAGAHKIPITASPSFWHEAGSGKGWSDVVFEPGDPPPRDAPAVMVPEPPAATDRRAVVHDDWLFDAADDRYPAVCGERELAECAGALEDAARACAQLGIGYIPAIVPAKRHAVAIAPASDRAWVEALIAHLRNADDIELIDLLPVLSHAARHGPAYHRTDAEWNARGAFFVARALLKEARKRLPSLGRLPLADLHLRPATEYRGTLADAPKVKRVGGELVRCELDVEAEVGVLIDSHVLHALRMPVESHLLEAGLGHMRVYKNAELPDGARLAIVGEAASLPLVPWLAECAHRTTLLWSRALPLRELELELPPVAFHLIREADLL